MQAELFERAAGYPGSPREKVVAMGEAEELFFRLCPHHYRALQTIRVAGHLGRMVNGAESPIQACESQLIALLMRIILQAVKSGDLRLRGQQRPPELAFTLWSLAFGTRALMDTGVATRQLGIRDGFRVARDACELLLDALNWRPLSSDCDYGQVRARIRETLFVSEWETLATPGKLGCR